MSDSSLLPVATASSPWQVINKLIAVFLALFAGFWGVALLLGGFQAAYDVRHPKPKTEQAAPAASGAAAPAVAAAAAGAPAPAVSHEIMLKIDPVNPIMFSAKEFTVKAGQKVTLTFENTSPIQHNVVIGKLGTKDALMAAANKAITDPAAAARGFIPEDPCVLAHTKLLNGGQKETVEFAVDAPGEYPFVCAFIGHTALMNGVIKAQ